MISTYERVEKIRALNYLLPILNRRSVLAHRAMKNATTADAFNKAVRQATEIEQQLEKYRNEWFDLTKP